MPQIRSKQILGDYPINPTDLTTKEYIDIFYSGNSLTIKDEYNIILTGVTTINFTGSGVTSTNDGLNNVNVDIPIQIVSFDSGLSELIIDSGKTTQQIIDLSSLSGSTLIIQEDDQVLLSEVSIINFTGSGITITTDSINNKVNIDIPKQTFYYNELLSELIIDSGKTTQQIIDLSSLSLTVKDENSVILTGVTTINFTGSGVTTITDSSNNVKVDIPIQILYFDSGTSQLIIDSGKTTQQIINLSSLSSKIPTNNINMVANNTSYLSKLACNTGLLNKNIIGSSIRVTINGMEVVVGVECYFSGDNGVTQRTIGNEQIGDKLYWMYNVNNPVAGYELSTSDKISFLYLTN